MKRREILKGLSLLPFAGGALNSIEPASATMMYNGKKLDWFSKENISPGPLKVGPQVYQSIGVEPIINCRGTFTIIGASIVLPEARQAMEYAHMINAQLDELAYGVGQRLAEITGAEWGVVSSGCAGGLKIVTAGVLSGGDPEMLVRIPMDVPTFEKNEVILLNGSHYDHAIRVLGVKYHRVRSIDEMKDAMNSRTCMVYMGSGGQVAEVAKITKERGIVLLVDAAANRLTIPEVNLQAGADVVAYSGGKSICGPQSAGLLLGKKGILQAAWQASAPHHGPARDNKIGREEAIGMLAAVESWAFRDHAAESKVWAGWANNIANRVKGIPSVVANVSVPTPDSMGNAAPRLTVTWDPNVLKITGRDAGEEMVMTKPRVAATGSDAGAGGAGGRGGRGGGGAAAGAPGAAPAGGAAAPTAGGRGGRGGAVDTFVPPAANTASLSFAINQMGEGNDKVVADKLYAVLSKKRDALTTVAAMKAPVANISGRWDVAVEYFNKTSMQGFIIEKQEGNFLQGTHKGSMSTRDMTGNIDGDKVTFSSRYNPAGQDGPIDSSVILTFYGTVSGDTMSGDIDMGEYITAKFTAKKHTYANPNARINIPKYRPLSS